MPTFSKLLQTPKEHCPSTQERIVKSVHQVSIDGRTSDDEIGDSRTSNSRIYLFKGLDTINCTQKSSLGGLGTSYVRDLSTSHVFHSPQLPSLSHLPNYFFENVPTCTYLR